MTHLGFVAAAYTLGVAVPAGFALSSLLRLSDAQRKLRAIDPRATLRGDAPGGEP